MRAEKRTTTSAMQWGISLDKMRYSEPVDIYLCVFVCFALLAVFWLAASYLRLAQRTMASPLQEHQERKIERKDTSTPLSTDTPQSSETNWVVADDQPEKLKRHPLYKRMAVLNGEVNMLPLAEVKQRLGQLNLCNRGIQQVLTMRLKHRLRHDVIRSDPSPPWDLLSQMEKNPYGLDYLCILDFEATCEAKNPPNYVHEVIEFPVLLLNLKTLEVEAEFHHYCRPWLNPVLSDFCKKLTGIRQDQVNRAPYFAEVFQMFTEWLESRELSTKYKFAVVTDCPWDIRECLFPQCVLARIPFPKYATKWIDVRKLFASFYQMKSGNLAKMLEYLGMAFEGRQHCGLHDTRNIKRVLVQIIKDGCVLKYNRFMPEDALSHFAKR